MAYDPVRPYRFGNRYREASNAFAQLRVNHANVTRSGGEMEFRLAGPIIASRSGKGFRSVASKPEANCALSHRPEQRLSGTGSLVFTFHNLLIPHGGMTKGAFSGSLRYRANYRWLLVDRDEFWSCAFRQSAIPGVEILP
jgi:hypothetical protein